ncbi:hypothetical protein [Methanolobus sp.]|uniref:hypothetical protein n=1 Tax=Methanolobus sp. TaxID=1874737 RepID=UPI0025F91774|nr:hypothetical protein [Methanolobus sp.]
MKIKLCLQKSTPRKYLFHFIADDRAWIDLLLSKVALIFVSIIILAALYHLAADAGRMNHDRQLDLIAQDFCSAINSAGKSSYETAGGNIYFFDAYNKYGNFGSGINASVSGEYVSVSFEENGRRYGSVKPLMYKTLPLSEDEVRGELMGAFSANGNISQPIPAFYGYTAVTEFLAALGTKEENLNTSMEVHIEKTLIYIHNLNGTEVKELEYILVHQ